MKRFLTLIVLATTIFQTMAYTKHTLAFKQHGSKILYLDHYASDSNERANERGLRPCVIFLFGGGFATGTRDRDLYIPFFERMCKEGCDVVSIDYRLGLAPLAKVEPEKRENMGLRNAIETMTRAVEYATEDALHATSFVLKNAERWGIDTSRIIISGSSAGAIASLQAEYSICNGAECTKVLPEGFNFGGVISFAGAIYSTTGAPKWLSKPCPILFFHGTADGNVPYDKASIFGIGMFGPAHITKDLKRMESPYIFHSSTHRTHDIAVTPMYDNVAVILDFIDTVVSGRKPLQRLSEEHDLSIEPAPHRFSVREYLTNNYGSKEEDDKEKKDKKRK